PRSRFCKQEELLQAHISRSCCSFRPYPFRSRLMRRTRLLALTGLLLVPALAGGFIFQDRVTRDGAVLFDQVLTLVSQRFVDTVDAGALYEKAARGLLDELKDPYSELYSPEQLKQFEQNTG